MTATALREELAERGARANVRLMPNRVNLPPFNKRLYRQRNLVERLFNKLKHFRGRRNSLRQSRQQLSRIRQTRLSTNLDAL